MPLLPAVCDSCGTIFQPRAINVENSSALLQNVRVGPCPRCGAMGHIPDGVYNVVGNAIEILSAPHASPDVERIAEIFRRARERKATAKEVASEIRRETPDLSRIADLLPQTRAELYAFLGLLIAAAALLKTSGQTVTINQVINQVTIEAPKEARPRAEKRKPQPAKPPSLKKENRRLKKRERQAQRRARG